MSTGIELDEARTHLGCAVVFHQIGRPNEEGVITSVNDHYVFVRYGKDYYPKATPSHMLSLIMEHHHR